MLIIPALMSLRQENCQKSKVSLGYVADLVSRNQKINRRSYLSELWTQIYPGFEMVPRGPHLLGSTLLCNFLLHWIASNKWPTQYSRRNRRVETQLSVCSSFAPIKSTESCHVMATRSFRGHAPNLERDSSARTDFSDTDWPVSCLQLQDSQSHLCPAMDSELLTLRTHRR